MKRPFKILLIIVGGLLALLIVAAIALPLFFNPNNYSSKVSDYVKQEYGRTLEIGDVKLSVFPWLRVKLSNVKVDNAKGFGTESFADIGVLSVGVKLMPLILRRQVEASAIQLDGLKLNLAKNAQGRTNWEDFIKKPEDKKPEDKNKTDNGIALENINISGVEVKDSSLTYSDLGTGKRYAIDKLNLKTGTLRPGKPFDANLALVIDSKAPQARAELKLNGTVLADATAKTYVVSGLALDADLSGAAVPGGKMNTKLSGDVFFNQATGAARFSKLLLKAAGVTLNGDINAEGLMGDSPKLAGPITIAAFNPREAMSKLGMKVPDTADKSVLTQASFQAQYAGTFKSASLSNLALKLDQTTFGGNLTVRDFSTQAIEFALKGDSLDADRYLSPKAAEPGIATSGSGANKKTDINSIKIPTEALDGLNVNGTVTLNSLKISGLKLSDVSLRLSGAKDSPKEQQLSAKLYGGQVSTNTRIGSGGKPTYALKTQLSALNAGPLLTDFFGKDYVSGLGNVSFDLTSAGTTVGDVRRALNGDLSFKLENGAVKGFNLAQIIRSGQAMLNGQAATATNEVKQTDFTSFSATAKIINGILQSDTLNASSPLFRLAGAGQIDLINETINYTAKPTIVQSSEGQGGKGLDALRGLTIPIRLTGNLLAPKYELALNDIIKEQATAKLNDLIKDKLGGSTATTGDPLSKENLGNTLINLFGKKAAPAPQPQTTPAQ